MNQKNKVLRPVIQRHIRKAPSVFLETKKKDGGIILDLRNPSRLEAGLLSAMRDPSRSHPNTSAKNLSSNFAPDTSLNFGQTTLNQLKQDDPSIRFSALEHISNFLEYAGRLGDADAIAILEDMRKLRVRTFAELIYHYKSDNHCKMNDTTLQVVREFLPEGGEVRGAPDFADKVTHQSQKGTSYIFCPRGVGSPRNLTVACSPRCGEEYRTISSPCQPRP